MVKIVLCLHLAPFPLWGRCHVHWPAIQPPKTRQVIYRVHWVGAFEYLQLGDPNSCCEHFICVLVNMCHYFCWTRVTG